MSGSEYNLETYIAMSLKQIEGLASGFQLYKSIGLDINGMSGHVFEYSAIQGKFELHFLQYIVFEEEKAYVLTFTAEDKTFEKYRAAAERTLNSFILL
jgi:hypothetical protein